jgi:hypothetical protein
VALQRHHRVPDAKSFLNGFYSANKAPRRILISLIFILILAMGNYFYVQTIKVEETPFESLTLQDQKKFHQFISEGKLALSLGDLEGAAFNANQAFLLHQSHSDIESLKSSVVEIIENNLDDARNETETEFFTKQMQALKEYPAFAEEKH